MYNLADLILTQKGQIYHLNLIPEQLADIVITVGDPARVAAVSKYFDCIEYRQQHREFVVHTGYLAQQRITVLSSGIGTGTIDIVLNELDALANIDFLTRQPKQHLRKLKIIRIGTCGALHEEIPIDSFIVTNIGIGFDNLMHFYQQELLLEQQQLQQALARQFPEIHAYAAWGDTTLINQLSQQATMGMTATMPGFYGPQGRLLRVSLANPHFVQQLSMFNFNHTKIMSFDMETSAIYALSTLLGHACCSIAVVVAQRQQQQFTSCLEGAMDRLIQYVLQQI